jgi:hypothetical protein
LGIVPRIWRRKTALFGERRNRKERTMPTKLTYLRSDLVGRVLSSLVLLGIWTAPAASDPRLLWHTEPQHG